jgi:hypothetical protein
VLAFTLTLGVVLGAGEGLGPPLRQDGFQFKPPATFRMARMDLFHGTHAGSVSRDRNVPRWLSAALVDGDGEDAASILVSIVDEGMSLGASSRDDFATAVKRHLRDELNQPFQLERSSVTNGRVEVLGSVRQGSQLRRILVAAWPGEGRHVVALFSAPSGRWDALAPSIAESFNSMHVDQTPSRTSQQLVWAFAALLAGLLIISVGVRRRRRETATFNSK